MIKKTILLALLTTSLLHGFSQNYQIYKEAYSQKNYLKSKVYLLKILDSAIAHKKQAKVAIIYHQIGQLYTKTGEHYKAIEYYNLSLKLTQSQKKPNKNLKLKNFKELATAYSSVGNLFMAFKYSTITATILDKRFGKDSLESKLIDEDVKELQSRLISASIL